MYQQIKDKFIFKIPNKEARNTLFAALLLKFGGGAVTIWYNMVLYVYSYYYYKNPEFNIASSQVLLNKMMVPCTLVIFISVYVAEKIGYKIVIRIGAFLFPLGIFMCSYAETFEGFLFYYIICSVSSFTLMTIPIINCLWTQFRNDTGKCTGLAMFSFEVSTLFYNVLQLYLINPQNLEATVLYQNNDQKMYLFDEQVIQNFQLTFKVLGIIVGLCTIPSSYFIVYNRGKNGEVTEDIQQGLVTSPSKSLRVSENFDQIIHTLEKSLKKQKSDNIQEDQFNNIAKQQQIQFQKELDQNQDIELKNLDNQKQQKNQQDMDNQQEAYIPLAQRNSDYECKSFRQGLFSFPFFIICFISFIWSVYSGFYAYSFKIYGIMKINDDYFLTYLVAVTAIIKAVSNIVWGVVADNMSSKQLYIGLTFGFSVIGILYPFLSNSYLGYILVQSLVMVFNAGFMSIIGPVLIQLFGLRQGERLLPIKSGTLYLALLVVPMCMYLAIKVFTFDTVFIFLGLMCLVGTLLATRLKNQYKWN